jgi:hypothetical protein
MSVTALQRAVDRVNQGDVDGYMEPYAENVELHGYPPGVDSWETLGRARPARAARGAAGARLTRA